MPYLPVDDVTITAPNGLQSGWTVPVISPHRYTQYRGEMYKLRPFGQTSDNDLRRTGTLSNPRSDVRADKITSTGSAWCDHSKGELAPAMSLLALVNCDFSPRPTFHPAARRTPTEAEVPFPSVATPERTRTPTRRFRVARERLG